MLEDPWTYFKFWKSSQVWRIMQQVWSPMWRVSSETKYLIYSCWALAWSKTFVSNNGCVSIRQILCFKINFSAFLFQHGVPSDNWMTLRRIFVSVMGKTFSLISCFIWNQLGSFFEVTFMTFGKNKNGQEILVCKSFASLNWSRYPMRFVAFLLSLFGIGPKL